jgi:MFS family permease
MTTDKIDSLWSRTFVLLCLAQFLGYAHNAILGPTIPIYITHLGGSAFLVGLVMAMFTVTSVLLRPFIGYWADAWSQAGVLASGLFILGLSILLCFVPIVGIIMFANGLRGIGWAGLNTGGYTVLALAAPLERRGEASGYYSGAQSAASVFFPAVGLWLIDLPSGGFPAVIFVSGALALAGAGLAVTLGKQAPRRRALESSPRAIAGERLWSLSLVDRDVLLPTGLLFCLNLPHPAVSGFLVLHARQIGIQNIGWYYVTSGLTHVLARPVLGRLSDKIGRGRSLLAGFSLEVLALVLLATASSLVQFLISAVVYALGLALGTTSTTAMAMEQADPQRRGRAMATFSIAFPLSVGAGALVAGSVVEIAGYFWMFLIMALPAAGGVFLALANWPSLGHKKAPHLAS